MQGATRLKALEREVTGLKGSVAALQEELQPELDGFRRKISDLTNSSCRTRDELRAQAVAQCGVLAREFREAIAEEARRVDGMLDGLDARCEETRRKLSVEIAAQCADAEELRRALSVEADARTRELREDLSPSSLRSTPEAG